MLRQGPPDSLLTRTIAALPVAKAARLMELLYQEQRQHHLQNLYDVHEQSAQANQWRDFCRHYAIEFLGGCHSRSYKVTNIDPFDPQYGRISILKMDQHLGRPSHIEPRLRDSINDFFCVTELEYLVQGVNDEKTMTSSTLEITDYCSSGSVEEHSARIRASGRDKTFYECSTIMGQMAEALQRIQEADCCLPDATLSNWQVADGQLRLRL